MKKIITILIATILIYSSQLFSNTYITLIIIWIVMGGLQAFFTIKSKTFLIGLISGIIATLLLLYVHPASDTTYLNGPCNSFGFPSVLVPLIFILFNGLNAAFCFLLGGTIVRFFR